MKVIEKRIIDITTDKELLITNLDLSARAKNILTGWLKIKTFGELLELDYESLVKTRSLGKITLDEIVNFVHEKGYFLRNENISWDLKRKKLSEMGFELLEDELNSFDLAVFLYKNNLFMLADLKEYGSKVFKLNRMGKTRKKELEDFLKSRNIVLTENETINTLEKIKKRGSYTPSDLDISIKCISNLWYLSKDTLIDSEILTLNELINIDYNELKDKIGEYIDYDNEILLEIVNFLNSYGLSINGYDRTIFGVKLFDSSKEVTQAEVDTIESENLDIQVRLDRKKNLIARYNEAIAKRNSLLEEVTRVDGEISAIIASMKNEEGIRYVREKNK